MTWSSRSDRPLVYPPRPPNLYINFTNLQGRCTVAEDSEEIYSRGLKRRDLYVGRGRAQPIDQESLVIVLLRDRVKLLAYITAIVRDNHLAEDIFQEVALLAVRKRD